VLFIDVTLDHLGILAVVVIDRELGQLVCNAIVAVDTGLTFCPAAFMTFTRVTVLLTEIHGFELMAVAVLPGIRRAHRFPYTLRQVQSACFEFLRRVNCSWRLVIELIGRLYLAYNLIEPWPWHMAV